MDAISHDVVILGTGLAGPARRSGNLHQDAGQGRYRHRIQSADHALAFGVRRGWHGGRDAPRGRRQPRTACLGYSQGRRLPCRPGHRRPLRQDLAGRDPPAGALGSPLVTARGWPHHAAAVWRPFLPARLHGRSTRRASWRCRRSTTICSGTTTSSATMNASSPRCIVEGGRFAGLTRLRCAERRVLRFARQGAPVRLRRTGEPLWIYHLLADRNGRRTGNCVPRRPGPGGS